MPLGGTGDQLGDSMAAAVNAAATASPEDRQAIFRALGNAIINHILANGADAVTVVVASATSVVGPAPGVGVGTIT